VSDQEAWAVGYDEEHVRRVYNSKDGGATWDAVAVPGNGSNLTSITFTDAQHGWAVGGNGLIIRTTDGGNSWELLKPPPTSELQAVYFLNPQVGFVGGRSALLDSHTDEVTGFSEILCTKDGGDSWRRCYKQDEPSSFFQLTCLSESVAFAVLGANQLIRTEDQGSTWAEVPKPAKYVYAVAQSPDGTTWLAGSQGLHSSNDGGKTWRQPESLPKDIASKGWKAISFNDRGQGIAVGESGAIALTTDGGSNWKLSSLTGSEELRVIRMRDSSAFILGATNAYHVTLSP
jgi:photosystem II stability/assembly factor-like uncharacterized protein